MDYIAGNKAAWEEAFAHRYEGWCGDMAVRLRAETLPYVNPMLRDALLRLDLRGNTVAQFCCNNGREILSVMGLGAKRGMGFDIAENMVQCARETAAAAGIPCEFQACDVLTVGETYAGAFDFLFFTIGAITWFQDLRALFSVAARCLKPGGTFLINDFHPLVNMLPLPGEEAFDAQLPNRLAYSYFRTEPWLEQNSGAYMTQHRNQNTFTSFSHTMAEIVSAAIESGLAITSLREFDRDIGMTDAYEGLGFPLSYLLTAEKKRS